MLRKDDSANSERESQQCHGTGIKLALEGFTEPGHFWTSPGSARSDRTVSKS